MIKKKKSGIFFLDFLSYFKSNMMVKLGRDLKWVAIFSNWQKFLMKSSSLRCFYVIITLVCHDTSLKKWKVFAVLLFFDGLS